MAQVSVLPTQAEAAPGEPGGEADEAPKVVDGLVQVRAVLEPAADTPAAQDVVKRLRVSLDQVGSDVLVGGQSAINLDVRSATDRDLRVVVPAVLAVILLVLALLLRSLVAPLLLVVANVLSFGATSASARWSSTTCSTCREPTRRSRCTPSCSWSPWASTTRSS